MTHLLLPLILLVTIHAQHTWESSIDPQDGLTYIRAAEDLTSSGIHTSLQRTLIVELYVLAAVTDPRLRDSSILGILKTLQTSEDNEPFIHQLQLLMHNKPPLVPSVVNIQYSPLQDSKVVESVCNTLSLMRQGKTITAEQADTLKLNWSNIPDSFDIFFQDTQRRRKQLSQDEIEITLKVELAILGGSTLWSADVVTSGGHPVVMSMSDDLATLLSVDPTKRIREKGRWVTLPRLINSPKDN